MARLRVVSLEEQLEVDKLNDKEIAANKSGEFDILYDDLENQKKVEEVKKESGNEEPLSTDTSSDSEDVSSNDGNNSSTDNTDVLATEKDSETEAAVESFKNLKYAEEAFVASQALDFMAYLGVIGLKFGGDVVKHVYKGVALVFAGIGKLIYSSSVMLRNYLQQREQALDNLKKSIQTLRKSLDEVKENEEQKDISDLKFTNKQTLNTLKAGHSVDFIKNINQLTVFNQSLMKKFVDQIKHEQDLIGHIMMLGRTKGNASPLQYMGVNGAALGMAEGVVNGYQAPSEDTVPFHTSVPLPADVIMIATLPRQNLENKEVITRAYNDSSIILGIDSEKFQTVDQVDYMTSEQLSDFLDRLDALCDSCAALKSDYEKIIHNKETLKISLKNYFNNLSHSAKKVSVNESFMDLVYLKVMITDKVYLTAMIDFQDYVSKVLVAGTRFAKVNIEKLS